MNKKKTKTLFTILLFISLLFLTGCNMLEIEDYAIVAGIGIDFQNNQYEITYEIYEEKDGQTTDMSSNIKSGKGDNISAAINEISNKLNRKPYLNHASIVILNNEAIKQNFDDLVNYLLHDVRIRSACYIMASKNQSAKDIFKKSEEQKKVISYDIYKHLDVKEGLINKWSNCKLNDVINDKLENNGTVIIPTITYENDCDINGVYLISNDNKILSKDNEVFVFQIFKNVLIEGLFDIGGLTDFYINKIKSNLKYIGNSLLLKVDMKILTYEILELEEEEKFIQTIRNELSAFIYDVYNKYVNINFDPFGLYKFFKRHFPDLFYEGKDYYIFLQSLELKVEINIDLLTSGLSEERI